MHITSLPGPSPIGDIGPEAFHFIDFLEAAGQSVWQILPTGPTTAGNSPYSAFSAFAGNPLLISIERLKQDGHLDGNENFAMQVGQNKVDYQAARQQKLAALEKAFSSFRQRSNSEREELDRYTEFCHRNAWWLDDFALFSSLMHQTGHSDWCRWETPIRMRDPQALAAKRSELAGRFEYERFVQYLFFSQWCQLKSYANERGIQLFGDMPIYVSHQSCDVWSNQSLFELDDAGQPTLVAGVPPDYFSETGQLWGNPIYRWDAMRESGYEWWIRRFEEAFRVFDLLRVDHFRGFEAYWQVPHGEKTAINGQWVKGPGAAPFRAAQERLGELPIIAEDLGLITKEVIELRDQLAFPGMRVLQFGFDSKDDDTHRPDAFTENSIAYTGTHDNDTIVGWYLARANRSEDLLRNYLNDPNQYIHWQLIEMLMKSRSRMAIVPMQDLLGLDNSARMNVPGQAEGNWEWRLQQHQISPRLAEQLRELTTQSNRVQHLVGV